METLAIIATICATLITTIWFIRDVRKENSKVLKRQEEVLMKIEEGQRQGFTKLSEDLVTLAEISKKTAEILERVEKGQEEGFKTLAKISAKTA